MGSKFQLILLDNVAEVIDSRHKTPNYTETGYPMVRVVDIKNGELDLKNTKRVTKDIYEDFSKGRSPQIGDLIISRVGSYGNISYVSKNEKFCLGQNTAFIIPNEKNSYLYYALISPFVQQQINDMAVGAVQKTISLKSIKNLKIPYPELNIRNIISKKLRVIDNRISTNDKINQILEKMSQTLFKSWFVDFDPVVDNALDTGNPIPEALQSRAELRQKVRNCADFKPLPAEIRSLFPSEFEETELGWVPKGWHYKNAEEIATISIGKTPPRTQKECFCDKKDSNYAWVSIKDLGNCSVFIKDSSEYLTSDAVNSYNVKIVPKDAVLLSFKLTIGRIAIAEDILTTNEAIAHFYNMKHGINKEYLYSYLKIFDYNSLGSTSSIATAINSKIIRKIPVLVPDGDILEKYKKSTDIIFQKIKFNNGNICNLTALRDTLLPKLISGELSLEDLPDLTTDTEAA
ncbi:TPA: restriction endonuclease subunit S [Escherichia coli]|uniref:restriction endonuclease subunit S n=1 Tax=Escherichia coli TaxID=562 RepID=UPI000BE5BA28|nr:restriction endonuclease subunit S [Escherichia coli]MBE8933090.1 restriction endonuclease subunit S [Escherichia coli]HDJ7932826.1 restriction endonuclease subunit S [Escherichia coli]HDJ7939703.1 restriction endonuclease subunit S [Escherichia coli]HDJ8061319.1 restriction endonuclease subunit S [Escherichia coli]